MMRGWKMIIVREDTHKQILEMKGVNKFGNRESFDDVIRRGMGFDKPEETSP
jgi:predicted CopG family antitoxin